MDTVQGARTGTRFGGYQIGPLLGRGGMGEVYQATDTDKDRVVALKILADNTGDPDYRRRFTREAHAAAQLQEPHVIPIHDWGEIDGHLYIDMRLVRGSNLRELLAHGPIAPARAVAVCAQIAGALDAAHAQGLIHRDIKPANIVLTAGDFAYLLDFGIAEQAGDTRLTRTGMTVGSLAYLAPERLNGAEATPAVDVYGLACVLYECLTGTAPFGADTMARAITEQLYAPPPLPSAANPAVPRALDGVIACGMAKTPGERYRSAGQLAAAAHAALSDPGWAAAAGQAWSGERTAMAPTGYPAQVGARGRFGADAPLAPAMPPVAPVVVPPAVTPPASTSGRRWVIAAAIGAALLFATASLGIGLMLGRHSSPDSASSAAAPSALTRLPVPEPVPSAPAQPAPQPIPSQPIPAPPPPPAPPPQANPVSTPPSVGGPDPLGVRCDGGFARIGAHGFGSRALRGSASTSCVFVDNVLDAYWATGLPSAAPREIAVRGSRACGLPGDGRCAGARFVMDCAVYGADDWITCAGGKGARVYLY